MQQLIPQHKQKVRGLQQGRKGDPHGDRAGLLPVLDPLCLGEPPGVWVFLHLEVTKGKSSELITM